MSTKKEKCNINNSSISSSIQLFYYEGLSVRTINIDGEIWFVANDVADILGYRDAFNAIRLLDDDEKALFNPNTSEISATSNNVGDSEDTPKVSMLKNTDTTHTSYSGVEITIISEPGLYELVFRSNKPDAKVFSRWVRHDVLPSIRKNGHFSLNDEAHNDDILQKRIFMRQEKEGIKVRKIFWEKMLNALQSIDKVLLSNGPIPISGIPKGLNDDWQDIRFIENMKQFLKENIERKINSLDAKNRAIDTLADFR